MTRPAADFVQDSDLSCRHVAPTRKVPDLLEDVRNGLLTRPRRLAPKYFYDDVGSELFERICETIEYYPTRYEEALLRDYGGDIISRTLPDRILELGSGSSRKTRRLFDACEKNGHVCNYAPFDVCEPVLEQAACELRTDYPWLGVCPLAGDYHAGLGDLPACSGTTLYVFLGSTMGNFTLEEARTFLREVRACMKDGDCFLLGADRVKDASILEAAYNDAEGITAQFNLNVLRVLNRELEADFRPERFEHRAVFNEQESRIEMYLVSRCDQTVRIGKLDAVVHLETGERILTELSHKFAYRQWSNLLEESGLEIIRHYQPDNEYFSLILARPATG